MDKSDITKIMKKDLPKQNRQNWFLLILMDICYMFAIVVAFNASVFVLVDYINTSDMGYLIALSIYILMIIMCGSVFYKTYQNRVKLQQPDTFDILYAETRSNLRNIIKGFKTRLYTLEVEFDRLKDSKAAEFDIETIVNDIDILRREVKGILAFIKTKS